MKRLAAAAAASLACFAGIVHAQVHEQVHAQAKTLDGRFYVQTSLYTKHFNPDPRHNQRQRLLDIEYHRPDDWLVGFSVFRNSFGQPSEYLFVGKQWRPLDAYPLLYLKLTGGILHGYRGEFRDKIPFNGSGFAPVLLPSIGLAGKRFGGELVIFGTNGLMLTAGLFFDSPF